MKYTKEQLMLTFSYMSYYGFGLEGSDSENAIKIAKDVNKALKTWKPVKNKWELVWGPCAFAFKGDKFDDNLMFVVRGNEDPGKLVVAIRGTNPLSLKDWLIEDFDVVPMTKWKYGEKAKGLNPKISRGTDVGLTHLQEMVATEGVPGAGLSLLQFLQEAANEKKETEICVTGHSLGGALAPTLALWLKDIQGTEMPVNANISTVAFAGPSAGNEDFANYSDQRFGDQCVRIANSLDVVPYAWNTKSLSQLYFLYKPHLLFPGPILFGGFGLMIAMSFLGKYHQIKADTPALNGVYKPLLYNYFAQGLYQHAVGYPEIMGMLKNDDIPLAELFSGQLDLSVL